MPYVIAPHINHVSSKAVKLRVWIITKMYFLLAFALTDYK